MISMMMMMMSVVVVMTVIMRAIVIKMMKMMAKKLKKMMAMMKVIARGQGQGSLHILLRLLTASNACFRPDLTESTNSKACLSMPAHHPVPDGRALCARGLVGFAHLQRGALAGLRTQFRPLQMLIFAWIYLDRLFFDAYIYINRSRVYMSVC